MPRKLSLQYIAGFFDGEGCVNMARLRSSIFPRVLIVHTDRYILELLQEQFGGDINPVHHRRENWKPSWIWRLSWKPAVDFLRKIEPYLVVKDQQALTAIAWDEARPGHGGAATGWDEDGAGDLLVARMKWLNQKGPPQGEDPIDAVLREIEDARTGTASL